ncbi:MAG: hypothetical protein K1X74_20500 [Pirellulales bacterium]|nr:hypothetical protein [Pirellulales bacterium]
METVSPRRDLTHDLLLPTLLFAALGGMTWAVRGSSGYGAAAGCVFAGVAWGMAWWFISRPVAGRPERRYDSAWIVLAVTAGIGISGARGWMQWPSFFEGKLVTNYAKGEFVPISRAYGFLWLFIAGMPWAGLGACLLAWTGSLRETRLMHWLLRIGCGIGGALVAWGLYVALPQLFLPMYDTLAERYQDLEHNPNLRRLINDSWQAIVHLGVYLGLLGYEAARREGKNVLLIATVGLVNGAGWALLQNWKWATEYWEGANFNFWRCWESSGGISIGIGYGVAYFLANRPLTADEATRKRARRPLAVPDTTWLAVYLLLAVLNALLLFETCEGWGWPLLAGALVTGPLYYAIRCRTYAREPATAHDGRGDPNLERVGLYLGLLLGLGISLECGLKGFFNIYYGDEDAWDAWLWQNLGPAFLVVLALIWLVPLVRPLARGYRGELFPHAAGLMWLVLLVLNVLAHLVTGPPHVWNEFVFNLYYMLLFLITAAVVLHYSALYRGARQ